MNKVIETEMLIEIRDWAEKVLASGNEPPKTWLQLRQLIKDIDEALSTKNSVIHKS